LRAAIEARKSGARVLLVSRPRVGYGSNTVISQSMLAVAMGRKEAEDSSEVHFEDTIVAGRFLSDQRLVKTLVEEAEKEVCQLEKFGVDFKKRDGSFRVVHAPGHTYPRHISGARRSFGIDLIEPLQQYALRAGVRFEPGVLVTRLLKRDGEVVGATGFTDRGELLVFQAAAVILATGGASGIFLRTDNVAGSTGDGYALAYEAGATLRDMEFTQFYPTALGEYGVRIWWYELFLPRGAVLRNSLGENVLEKQGLNDALAMTRDKLTRLVMNEILDGRGINGALLADLSPMGEERLEQMRPYLGAQRVSRQIRVAPTAHYFMGGIEINEECETGVPGLYAAGEVTGGIHGANRLAGNALTDIFVFGAIAGKNAANRAPVGRKVSPAPDGVNTEIERLQRIYCNRGRETAKELQQLLRNLMWYRAGIVRNKKDLQQALGELQSLQQRLRVVKAENYRELMAAVKLGNMILVSEMVCRAALARKESRGSHFRTDYPEENNIEWLQRIIISRQDDKMDLSIAPVDLPHIKPPESPCIHMGTPGH